MLSLSQFVACLYKHVVEETELKRRRERYRRAYAAAPETEGERTMTALAVDLVPPNGS